MSFQEAGWALFEDPALLPWVEAVRPVACEIAADEAQQRAWLRHGGTWFAGVNALPNDAQGAVSGGPALTGVAVEAAGALQGDVPDWDKGQISVVYPGYPQKDASESDAAHRFRRNRDAAHVDGLLPVGPARRRKMQEPHCFVLGIPLTACSAGASPMVVWEGSHEIMRDAFRVALAEVPLEAWGYFDLTDIYQAGRRRCFEECRRMPVIAQPGQAYVIHRLALHGVAPWEDGSRAPEEGRMIVYFRPPFPGLNWLDAP
ncbi:MAG: hypothetical protein AAF576_03205 [Pseudomonadota bacterium]